MKNVLVNSIMNTSHAKTQSRKAVFLSYFLAPLRENVCVYTSLDDYNKTGFRKQNRHHLPYF